MTLRSDVTEYIRTKYGCDIEYPWLRFPEYGIFRHADNQKWFALLMNVPRAKLGLPGDGVVDVLNVKLDDLLLRELLLRREGFLPGYHISRGNWISILLDGSAPLDDIRWLTDTSFRVTATAATRQAIRPPKEWLVPSNPKYFDIVQAFNDAAEINWKQGKGIKRGDTVFMYVGAPISAILYKCEVTQTDIPWRYSRPGLTIPALMKILLIKRYEPERFTFETLRTKYGVGAVRGPRGIPASLSEALK